jgi:hypothetical protein
MKNLNKSINTSILATRGGEAADTRTGFARALREG